MVYGGTSYSVDFCGENIAISNSFCGALIMHIAIELKNQVIILHARVFEWKLLDCKTPE